MKAIISDFDNTLFRKNYGLITETVEYLESRGLPVIIVTYRAKNQYGFISKTLSETKLNIVAYGFAESRQKDPQTKSELAEYFASKYDIVEALDDDPAVVVEYMKLGIKHRSVGKR